MSLADARKFVQQLHTDPHLRTSVHLDRKHLVTAARRAGYKVKPAEVRQAINEHWNNHAPGNRASVVLSEAPGF